MDLIGVRWPTTFDNVWDIDCSIFFPPTVEGRQIHSAFFDTGNTLMRELLRGIDRTVLPVLGLTQVTYGRNFSISNEFNRGAAIRHSRGLPGVMDNLGWFSRRSYRLLSSPR